MAPVLLFCIWDVETAMMRAAQTTAMAGILALATFLSGSSNRAPIPDYTQVAQAVAAPEGLSAHGAEELRSILSTARLAELRWPDFSNYKTCIAEIYTDTHDRLIWIKHSRPTPEATAMIRALENAEEKGLTASDYDGPRWAGRLAELNATPRPTETQLLRFDMALTVSAMRYVYELHMGRLDPRSFHNGFDVERNKYDLARFLLRRIAQAPDIRSALREIEPPFTVYHRTIQALAKYRQLAREYRGGPLPVPKKTVDPGQPYSALTQLAHLLRLLGDLPPEASVPPGNIYQGALIDAVKRFQKRHGLEPDGRIGHQTFSSLNTPLSHRVVQLQLALERWRWLPHEFARPPVIVNIPEFRLHAMNGEYRQAFSMKVVVGKAFRHKTPVFAAAIDGVVLRPYWNVPYSIQVRELLPNLRKNRGYLIKNDYEVVDARRRVVSEGRVNAEILEGLEEGTLHARQRPGPKNSLGLLKFDMPNPYDVYMHGTPATLLFSRSRRDFSHGCIRVEDPVSLAVWVLRDNPGWTKERVLEAMNGDQTFREKLAKPVPVLIVYGTAIVSENGDAYFFRDVYGLDASLAKALAAGRPYPPANMGKPEAPGR